MSSSLPVDLALVAQDPGELFDVVQADGSPTGLTKRRDDVLQAIVEATRAQSLIVSGQGLREGIALEARGGSLPSIHALREASIERSARDQRLSGGSL